MAIAGLKYIDLDGIDKKLLGFGRYSRLRVCEWMAVRPSGCSLNFLICFFWSGLSKAILSVGW